MINQECIDKLLFNEGADKENVEEEDKREDKREDKKRKHEDEEKEGGNKKRKSNPLDSDAESGEKCRRFNASRFICPNYVSKYCENQHLGQYQVNTNNNKWGSYLNFGSTAMLWFNSNVI